MELITRKLSLKDMGALMVQHIFLFEVSLLTVSITSVQVFYLKPTAQRYRKNLLRYSIFNKCCCFPGKLLSSQDVLSFLFSVFSLLWLLQLSGLYFYFSPFPSTPVQFPCALTFVAPVEIHEVPLVLGFTGLATKPRAQWAHCYAPTAALDFRAINSCRSEMSWTPSINHRPPSSGDKTNNRQPNVKPRVKPGATKHKRKRDSKQGSLCGS